MSDTKDRIIGRIKKLMSQAEGTNFEAEMDTALKMARDLMLQHGISEQSIIVEEEDTAVSAKMSEHEVWGQSQGIANYHRWLMGGVCDLTDTRFFWRSSYRGKNGQPLHNPRSVIHVYGLEHDCSVAISLFNELKITMLTVARMTYGTKWTGSHNDYCKGFASRISERASELVKEPIEDPNCTAIVLKKDVALDLFAEKHYPNMRTAKSRQAGVGDWGAYTKGSEDGQNVSLGTNGLGSSDKKTKQLK